MNPSVVRLILAESRKQGLKEKSLALRLSALRQFFSYLVQQGQMKVNPATGIFSAETRQASTEKY